MNSRVPGSRLEVNVTCILPASMKQHNGLLIRSAIIISPFWKHVHASKVFEGDLAPNIPVSLTEHSQRDFYRFLVVPNFLTVLSTYRRRLSILNVYTTSGVSLLFSMAIFLYLLHSSWIFSKELNSWESNACAISASSIDAVFVIVFATAARPKYLLSVHLHETRAKYRALWWTLLPCRQAVQQF